MTTPRPGGRYIRNSETGAVTRVNEAESAAVTVPAETAAADPAPVAAKRGSK